jgi:hypothetical protein
MYALFSCQRLKRLGGLFVMRNLLAQPFSHRISLEPDQGAPKPVEIFPPRHEGRSAAAVIWNRAVQVCDGLL